MASNILLGNSNSAPIDLTGDSDPESDPGSVISLADLGRAASDFTSQPQLIPAVNDPALAPYLPSLPLIIVRSPKKRQGRTIPKQFLTLPNYSDRLCVAFPDANFNALQLRALWLYAVNTFDVELLDLTALQASQEDKSLRREQLLALAKEEVARVATLVNLNSAVEKLENKRNKRKGRKSEIAAFAARLASERQPRHLSTTGPAADAMDVDPPRAPPTGPRALLSNPIGASGFPAPTYPVPQVNKRGYSSWFKQYRPDLVKAQEENLYSKMSFEDFIKKPDAKN